MSKENIALYVTAFIVGWIVARPSEEGLGRLLAL